MEEAHFIFTSEPLELKSEGEDFFVEGYISTSDLDLVNDIVTKSCLLDMAEQMKERAIKFDVEHESFRGKSNLEKEINKTTIPVAKVEDFLIDKKGLKVRAKLNRHAARFNEVKGSIEDGFLDAFSIAYIPVKAAIQKKDGIDIRLLDQIHLLNVAFTGNPVNTEARMTNVFAKSLEFLNEQEKAKAPKRPKPKVPESEYEDEDEEDKKEKIKKKSVWERTQEEHLFLIKHAHNGSVRNYLLSMGAFKDVPIHVHESDIIKLQEAKMSEDIENKPDEANPENGDVKPEGEGQEPEKKDEAQNGEGEPAKDPENGEGEDPKENAEVKSLKEDFKSLKEKIESQDKEIAELKAKLKLPVRKSPVEQQDKSKQFEGTEGKSLNPLDVIK